LILYLHYFVFNVIQRLDAYIMDYVTIIIAVLETALGAIGTLLVQ